LYGKHYASMYSGSMVGAGAVVFAVMGYVIANGKPDRKVGMQVDLNPKLLGFILGEPEELVGQAIEYLSSPDPTSRSEEEGGRRLVRIGEFAYRVVNGAKYRAIRDEERRRETDRESKRRQRERAKENPMGPPLPGEVAYTEAVEGGDEEAIRRAEANGQ
jgi:hypothetical protein